MLTDTQTRTLRAAIDRIIPADAYPGGWDAGVGVYFAQLFMKNRAFYRAVDRALTHWSRKRVRHSANRS